MTNRKPLKRIAAQHPLSSRHEIAREMKRRGMTYAEIGKAMGISRQRAQQLVAPTLKETSIQIEQRNGVCDECHKPARKLEGHHDTYDGAPTRYLCTACHRRADSKHLPKYKLHFHRTSKSGYTGVFLHKSGLWMVHCGKHIGYFKDKDEAARAYDKVLMEIHPDWTNRLNFPTQGAI
jgi:hypothetical protein